MKVNINPSKRSIGLKILYSTKKMPTIARLGTKLLKLHLLDITSYGMKLWKWLTCISSLRCKLSLVIIVPARYQINMMTFTIIVVNRSIIK